MDESAIEGLKLLDLNDASKPNCRSSVTAFSIEGFDTRRQSYLVGLEVKKHFASCGKFRNIRFIEDSGCRIIKSVAFMTIEGEGAEEKALALSGTDVGGVWTAIVKVAPRNILSTLGNGHPLKTKRVVVRGYDTSLPEIDTQMALCKHFSSCGVVTNVMLLPECRLAYVDIQGQGCLSKAQELSGQEMGEMTLVVEPLHLNTPGRRKRSGYTTGYMHPRFLPEMVEKEKEKEKELKMKMGMGKKKKMRMMMEMKMEKKKKKKEKEMEMETLS